MPYQKKNPNPQAGEKDGRRRGRGVSFRFDNDLFTSVWARHNNEYTEAGINQLTSKELYESFYKFVQQIFQAHVFGEVAKGYGCKEWVHNEASKFEGHKQLGRLIKNGSFVVTGEDAENAIYTYLYDKVKRKVDELLPVINEYNPSVTEPVGMHKAGWMWSKERAYQSYADKFNV